MSGLRDIRFRFEFGLADVTKRRLNMSPRRCGHNTLQPIARSIVFFPKI